MPRKLKAFTTSAGFFDLAVAAPSMKAALAAWGADSDLFHQGFARETRDAKIVAATMARPGLVLRRPVGTDQPYGETAEISERALVGHGRRKMATRTKPKSKPKTENAAPKRPASRTAAADRAAALAYEREEKRRALQEQREKGERRRAAARRGAAAGRGGARSDGQRARPGTGGPRPADGGRGAPLVAGKRPVARGPASGAAILAFFTHFKMIVNLSSPKMQSL